MGRKVKRTAVGLEEVGDYDTGDAPKPAKKKAAKRSKKKNHLRAVK